MPDFRHDIQLHAFCDGSTHAYAAAVYMRIPQPDSSFYTTLITAKSKICPTKPLTIPRTELCGAVLATKLTKWVVANNCWKKSPLPTGRTPLSFSTGSKEMLLDGKRSLPIALPTFWTTAIQTNGDMFPRQIIQQTAPREDYPHQKSPSLISGGTDHHGWGNTPVSGRTQRYRT